MVKSLAVYRQTMSSRFHNGFNTFQRRCVNEIDRGSCGLSKADDAFECQAFGQFGMHQVKVRPRGTPFLCESLVIELNYVVIFGVHHHDSAVLSHSFHRELDAAKIQP